MKLLQALNQDKDVAATGAAGKAGLGINFIARILGWRYWPCVLVLAALVVSLPAIRTGPLNDDFVHGAALIGPSSYTDRLAEAGLPQAGSGELPDVLFNTYIAVHPEHNLVDLKRYGALPWWAYDGLRVAFWRPLAALTHWLDYRLFPGRFDLMHVHSIVWFAAVVLVVALLYRRIAPVGWMAGLAGLMYLLNDDGYFPTMWIANRNLLIALVFGVLTLLAYDRWRSRNWRPGAVIVPVCLGLSLLSAEAGVATFAYLFAYEVGLGQGRLLRRGLALVPAFLTILLWRVLYSVQGYGASGGGFYFDPAREPLGYGLAVLWRMPFLLTGQWLTIPPDLHSFLPGFYQILLWIALTALTVWIFIILVPFLRWNRRARFWLIGMYGSALPFCATVPMSRSLLFAAIGAFGLAAEFIGTWPARGDWVPDATWRRYASWSLFLSLFIVHLPLAAASRIAAPHVTATLEGQMAETMELGSADASASQDLVIVNAPNPIYFLYDPYRRACEGRPLPRGMRLLAPAFNTIRVTRTGDCRLTVQSASDSLLDCQRDQRMDHVFLYRYLGDVRSSRHPLRVGQGISLPHMRVEVLAVDGRGFPTEAAFEFDVPLEDASLKWVRWDWDNDVYGPFELPAVGQSVILEGPF